MMMEIDMDAPLDFENEDPLLNRPSLPDKKRKKVIELDELVSDFYTEKSKRIDKESRRAKAHKNYDSDEDENGKEALLFKYVNDCQNEMPEIGGEEEIHEWGLTVFGTQKLPPTLVFPELQSCSILQSFLDNELDSLAGPSLGTETAFLEGLLVNGWLARLLLTRGHVEKSVATWTFNLLLYSSKEELRTSACDFWCAILLLAKVDGSSVRIDWLPSYCEIKGALEAYGFLFNFSSDKDLVHADSGERGPPRNIRAWVKFVAVCCQLRSKHSVFLASEAEQLTEVIIWLLLDPRLQGLWVLLHECMESLFGYFKDEEWTNSCEKIAKSLACRVPRDLNCLRTVECISGVNARSKHLRSAAAYQMLVASFDQKDIDEEILSQLISINVKEKDCDLFKVYIYLCLAENWLLSNTVPEHNPVLNEMWVVFLRNCSCQINSTDLRSYASKVRTKASYLLQGCGSK